MFDTITGHIGRNLWLWTAIGLGIALLGMLARNSLGKGFYLSEIIALAAMFSGTTMIIASQVGFAGPQPDAEDEAA